MKYLTDKNITSLRRLLRGDGKSADEIKQLFNGDPDLVVAAWEHYQGMTKADRDKLFAASDRLRKPRSVVIPSSGAGRGVGGAGADSGASPDVQNSSYSEVSAQNYEQSLPRRGRGPGKIMAGESFTLVLPSHLLASYRNLALSQQRPVSQLIRLAMISYLDSSDH